jgi:hypothetical protein
MAVSGCRIREGKRQVRHALLRFRRRGLAANVPMLIRRIGADDQKVVARVEPAMPGSNWQNSNVARFHDYLAPIWTSKHEARAAGSKSQNLMRRRMVVMDVVNAVAPLRRPSVASEGGFEQRSGIIAGDHDRVLVEEHGKARIVRDPFAPWKNEVCGATLARRPRAGANGRRAGARKSKRKCAREARRSNINSYLAALLRLRSPVPKCVIKPWRNVDQM